MAKPRGRRPRTHQQAPSSIIHGSSAAGQLAMPAPESLMDECSQTSLCFSVVYLVLPNLKTLAIIHKAMPITIDSRPKVCPPEDFERDTQTLAFSLLDTDAIHAHSGRRGECRTLPDSGGDAAEWPQPRGRRSGPAVRGGLGMPDPARPAPSARASAALRAHDRRRGSGAGRDPRSPSVPLLGSSGAQ